MYQVWIIIEEGAYCCLRTDDRIEAAKVYAALTNLGTRLLVSISRGLKLLAI